MAGELWLPSFYTPSLTGDEDFPSHGDKLLNILDKVWGVKLDVWQKWLIRHALEVDPSTDRLRFAEVIISVARQNGKSELGGAFGLYGLLQDKAKVIGIAQKVEQAEEIYGRVGEAVRASPSLNKRYTASGTRGIRSKDKTRKYVVKAGGEDKLNGIPMTVCLYDEVHLIDKASYNQAKKGTFATKGIIIGTTTAGDDNSELLKDLYERGKAQPGDEKYDERLGFFLWEAPLHLQTTDPAALIAANPVVACGRLDVKDLIRDVKTSPENQARRYSLNQFVSSEASWLPMNLWNRLQTGGIPKDQKHDVVFAIERSENWTYTSIVGATKIDGIVYTEMVAQIPNANVDMLEKCCVELQRFNPIAFVMKSATLKDLSNRLRDKGIKTEFITQTQLQNVCATAYSLIANEKVIHNSDAVINSQIPKGVATNAGDGWIIHPKKSSGEVDALLAMVQALWAADTMEVRPFQLFVG